MFEDIQAASEHFETHVPYSDAAFLILKSHLVIELHLLEFIRSRVSEAVFKEVSVPSDGSFSVRLLLARALADRDEIPPQRQSMLWSALKHLGSLRNDVAHTLESKGSKVADKMRAFIAKVDPECEFWNSKVGENELHREFRNAAFSLMSLLVIHRESFTLDDEMLNQNG